MGPLTRKRLHYDWHWVWNTGNGDIGNQGIHQMDLCRWALGQPKLAPRVMSIGGRFGYDDDGETPNTQISFLDYKPVPLIFEVRGLPEKAGGRTLSHFRGVRVGIVIECEGGYYNGGKAYDKNGKSVKQFKLHGGGGHPDNFYKAVRSRKVSDLNADILEGYVSSALCHMGNIPHQIGKEVARGEVQEVVKANKHAMSTFERFMAHLDANKIDVKKTPITLGPWLQMDPDKERFVGPLADKANKYLTRDYRKPFIVPPKA